MGAFKTNEILLEGLYREWLNSLEMYNQQLESIELLVKQIAHDSEAFETGDNVDELRHEILRTKKELEVLSAQVLEKLNKLIEAKNSNVVSLAQLIENNRLRERVLKTEQSVFYLRYYVSKLLSLAS